MDNQNRLREVTQQRLADFNIAIDNFDLNNVPANVDKRLHKAAYDALISIRDELAEELAKYG